MQCAILPIGAGFEHIVLNGPEALVVGGQGRGAVGRGIGGRMGEGAGVGLSVAQAQQDVVGLDVHDAGAVHHLRAGTGQGAPFRLVVTVEEDDIARAEVGAVGVGAVCCGKGEGHAAHPIAVFVHLEVGEAQAVVDIARRAFLLQRVVPEGGKAAALALGIAHLGVQLFGGQETEEAQIVGALQGAGLVDGRKELVEFRAHIFQPQTAAQPLFVEGFGGQMEQDVEAMPRAVNLLTDQEVAQADGAQEEGRPLVDVHQALAVARIEQEDMAELVGIFLKLIHEQGAIEQGLHHVLLARPGHRGIVAWRTRRHIVALARLLLDNRHTVLVGVEEVQATLNAEHRTEEGGLEQYVAAIVVADGFGQTLADELLNIALLGGSLLAEKFVVAHQFGTGHHAQGMVGHVGLQAFADGLMAVVNDVVEQLARQVTEVDVIGVGCGAQLIDKGHAGRFGIGLKAARDGGDIDQIVGLEDNQFGQAHLARLVAAHTHQMEHCALPQHVAQIPPIALAATGEDGVGRGVAHLQCRTALLVGGPDEIVVPTLRDDAQHVVGIAAPGALARLGGEVGLQGKGNGREVVRMVHEEGCSLDVIVQLCAQALSRGLRMPAPLFGEEVGARLLDEVGRGIGHPALLHEIVHL